jgi:hypothetical protein
MSRILITYAANGELVAEVDFSAATVGVDEFIETADQAGASLLWAHGGELADHGFRRVNGYVNLHADWTVDSDAACPVSSTGSVGTVDLKAEPWLPTEAFAGQWGHKRVDETTDLSDDGSVVLALAERGAYLGICTVWPASRLVDGPGVVPSARSARRKAQLLHAACALLGPGPIDMDTWGEDDESLAAYAACGFTIVVSEPGWERELGMP